MQNQNLIASVWFSMAHAKSQRRKKWQVNLSAALHQRQYLYYGAVAWSQA